MNHCHCFSHNIGIRVCDDVSLRLIDEQTRMLEDPLLDQNPYSIIAGSLAAYAPIGSKQFEDLYACATAMQLSNLIEIYDMIRRME